MTASSREHQPTPGLSALPRAGAATLALKRPDLTLRELPDMVLLRVHTLEEPALLADGLAQAGIPLPLDTNESSGPDPWSVCLRPGEWLLLEERQPAAELLPYLGEDEPIEDPVEGGSQRPQSLAPADLDHLRAAVDSPAGDTARGHGCQGFASSAAEIQHGQAGLLADVDPQAVGDVTGHLGLGNPGMRQEPFACGRQVDRQDIAGLRQTGLVLDDLRGQPLASGDGDGPDAKPFRLGDPVVPEDQHQVEQS